MGNITEQTQWEDHVYLIEKQDKVLGGEEGKINVQAKQLANRTAYLKNQVDGINRDRTGYAPKASPAFSGIPTAPTAKPKTSNTQIATTEFVTREIAALVGSAPAALDTLEELARALAGDANLKQTLLNEIGKKADATAFTALHDLFVGVPIPYPLATVPAGCLAMNGQRFDKNRYPKLGQKYPSGILPDLRGEFIRGWDNGRGVDAGRGLLSNQDHIFKSHSHDFEVARIVGQGGGTFATNKISYYPTKRGTGSGVFINGLNSPDFNADVYGDSAIYIKNQGGTETRPRNIAFQYICLAA